MANYFDVINLAKSLLLTNPFYLVNPSWIQNFSRWNIAGFLSF